MKDIGKGIAVLGIMASSAYIGVNVGKPNEIFTTAIIVCVLLWILDK
jgi:hypothetical protein